MMTQDDQDRALATINEAFEVWLRNVSSRKTHSMLQAERDHALEWIERLRSFHDLHKNDRLGF